VSHIKLVPMNELEYVEWSERSRENYCSELHKNGLTKEEAQKKTDDDFGRLLPEGLKSKDQFVFTIKDGVRWVGILWFGVRGAEDNRKAFIYDIELNESERGKKFGEQAMTLLEAEVKKIGLKHIGLHVFGHNLPARKLYEKLGYEITNLNLEKKL
jgi:ribosomal protein S18 acetylase RimI-like enzyme